jgi:hypothetical protein
MDSCFARRAGGIFYRPERVARRACGQPISMAAAAVTAARRKPA